jgi:hypothetical protein
MKEEFSKIVKREYKLVTNGYDHEDICPIPQNQLDTNFTLSHIGSINAARNPDGLWKVLSELIKQNTSFAKAIKIKLVGKVDIGVLKSIEIHGLTDYLERIEYMPHSDVMREIQKSQLLLLLINNTPNAKGILTGKIFEYLGSGRPILCIGPEDGDAASILNNSEAGQTADYQNHEAMRNILNEYFIRFNEQRLESNTSNRQKFSRKELAREIAMILNKI